MPEWNLVTRLPSYLLLVGTLIVTGSIGCSKLGTGSLTSDLAPPSQSAFARPQELSTEQAKARSESARNYIGQKIDTFGQPEARIVRAFDPENADEPLVKLKASTGPLPPAPSIAAASLDPEAWVAGSKVVMQASQSANESGVRQVDHQTTDANEAATPNNSTDADQSTKKKSTDQASPTTVAQCQHDGQCDCHRDPAPLKLDPVQSIGVADISDEQVSPTQIEQATKTTHQVAGKLDSTSANPKANVVAKKKTDTLRAVTNQPVKINRLRAIPIESSSRKTTISHPLRPLRATSDATVTTNAKPTENTESRQPQHATDRQIAATLQTPRVATIDADLVHAITAAESTSISQPTQAPTTADKELATDKAEAENNLSNVQVGKFPEVQSTVTDANRTIHVPDAERNHFVAEQPASKDPQSDNPSEPMPEPADATGFEPSTATPEDDESGNDFPATTSEPVEPIELPESLPNNDLKNDPAAWPAATNPSTSETIAENDFPVPGKPSASVAPPTATHLEETELPALPASTEFDFDQLGKTTAEAAIAGNDSLHDFTPEDTRPQPTEPSAAKTKPINIFRPADDRPESLPDLKQIEQAFAGLVSDQSLTARPDKPAAPASASSETVPDLGTQLDRTIRQVKTELEASADEASRNGLEVNLRLLELLKRQTNNLDQQQRMINNDQKRSLQHQLDALAVMLVKGETQPINTNEQTLASLKAAVEELESLADLRVANGRLCTQISGFGNFRAFPRSSFQGDQRMLVYCEVENQTSLPVNEVNGVVRFRTRLRGNLAIYDASGAIVQQREFPVIDDRAHKRRRDFYVYFPIQLQNLAVGDYRMELLIEDIEGSKTATLKPAIEFSVHGN